MAVLPLVYMEAEVHIETQTRKTPAQTLPKAFLIQPDTEVKTVLGKISHVHVSGNGLVAFYDKLELSLK